MNVGHYIYCDISEIRDRTTDWLWTYNNERHNMDIGAIPPYKSWKS